MSDEQKGYDYAYFRRYLEQLLDEAGESYRRASLAAGLHHSSVSNYMRGVRPSNRACLALADHFGVDPNEMLQAAGYETLHIFERVLPELDEMGIGMRELAARFEEVVNSIDQKDMLGRWHADLDAYIERQWRPPEQVFRYTRQSSPLDYIAKVTWDCPRYNNGYFLIPKANVLQVSKRRGETERDGEKLTLLDIPLPRFQFSLPTQLVLHLSEYEDSAGFLYQKLEEIFRGELRQAEQFGALVKMYLGASDAASNYREYVYDFLGQDFEGGSLLDTLSWFVFGEYGEARSTCRLAACPVCGYHDMVLKRSEMTTDYTFACGECGGKIFLTDLLDIGQSYGETAMAIEVILDLFLVLEQLLLIHMVRYILMHEPAFLTQTLFLQNGHLAFLERVGSMCGSLQTFVQFLFTRYNFYFVGLETDARLVELAETTAQRINKDGVFVLDPGYINTFVGSNKLDTVSADRIVFKTIDGEILVFTLPIKSINALAQDRGFSNLPAILSTLLLARETG